MQISLRLFLNNTWVDVSNFIGDTVSRVNYYDTTFDTAVVSLLLKDNSISGIKGNQQLQPGLPCYIRYHNESETVFYSLDEDIVVPVNQGPNRTFKHTLKLIDPSNELRFTKIPNLSFTQPVGDIQLNTTDYRILNANYTVNSQKDKNFGIVNTTETFDILKDNTNNDGIILQAGKSYNISVAYSFKNYSFTHKKKKWATFHVSVVDEDTEAKLIVDLKKVSNDSLYTNLIGGDSEFSYIKPGVASEILDSSNKSTITTDYHNWYLSGYVPNVQNAVFYFQITPSEDVYFALAQQTKQNRLFYQYALLLEGGIVEATNRDLETDVNISILEIDSTDLKGNKIMLNEAVEKVLNNINFAKTLAQPVRYRLDQITAGRIAGVPVSDTQLVNYTAWEALIKLAAEVEAIPYLSGPTFSEVKFLFRDEQAETNLDNLLIITEATSRNQEDYVRGYSVEINNLVNDLNISTYKKDPSANFYYSVRAATNEAAQITEDNAVYILKDNIYDKHQFRFKGGTKGGIKIKLKESGSTTTINDNTGLGYWDMTKYILEEKQYLAQTEYPISKDSQRRDLTLQKGNTLYYTKGNNIIKGLGFRPLARPGVFNDDPQAYPALVEMFILAAFEQFIEDGANPLNVTFDSFENYNPITQVFSEIEIKAIYPQIVNTNINLYKYDAETTQLDRITSTSTSDYQTSTTRLSKYLTSTINEKGNLDYIIDGIASPSSRVPNVGDTIVLNGIKYKINVQEITYSNKFNRFTLVLAENLINQNTNVGLNDERRSFEIADTNIVERTDKFRGYIKVISKVTDDNIGRKDNKDYLKYRANNISNIYETKQMLSKATIPLFNSNADYAITSAYIKVKPSLLEDEIKLLYPVNSYYLNTTMVFETEFEDNYSAGSTVDYQAVPGSGVNFKGNQPFNYTSVLGTVHQIDLRLLAGNMIGYNADGDSLPLIDTNWSNSEVTKINLSYSPNKDSREKLKLQSEVTFMSQDPETTLLYPALAKYSPLLDRSANNGSVGDNHKITYAFLKPNTDITLSKSKLNLLDIVKTEDELTLEQKITTIYGHYSNNELDVSVYEANAELYGLRIPYLSNAPILAIYNKDTLEVLLYHKLIPEINVDMGVSDLWFVPYNNLTNYVDELSVAELEGLDINVTVRHNPTDIPAGADTIFNLNTYATLNNIFLYPQLYTTNVSTFNLPDKEYEIINRATGLRVDKEDFIYEDISVDLVYQSGESLEPPIVTAVNTNICNEVQLTVSNPNPTLVSVKIDYDNGKPLANYTFTSMETATLQPETGFTKNATYNIKVTAAIHSGTNPIYTADSEDTVEVIKMPNSCVTRVSAPSLSIFTSIEGNDVVFKGTISNYNPVTANVYIRTTINSTQGSFSLSGSYSAYSYRTIELHRGDKSNTHTVKLDAYCVASGLGSTVATKIKKWPEYVWKYLGPEPGVCIDQGASILETECFIENEIRTASGYHDGYSGCIKIKCTKT